MTEVVRDRPRALWWPYSGLRWPPPRLVQLRGMLRCWRHGHPWNRWRRETEHWFEYLDAPAPYAWRTCPRCDLIERMPGLTLLEVRRG